MQSIISWYGRFVYGFASLHIDLYITDNAEPRKS